MTTTRTVSTSYTYSFGGSPLAYESDAARHAANMLELGKLLQGLIADGWDVQIEEIYRSEGDVSYLATWEADRESALESLRRHFGEVDEAELETVTVEHVIRPAPSDDEIKRSMAFLTDDGPRDLT
jgi:hypothetical protein